MARDAIRRFPKEVRILLGRGLFRLQVGQHIGMPNSRPMPGVAGVSEHRVKRGGRCLPRVLLHRVDAGCRGLSRVCEEDATDASAGNRLGEEKD